MAGNGPLPKPNAARRNAPAIAGTTLPAGGRTQPAPKLPRAYVLGAAGRAWWRSAWKLPQAAKWDAGAVYAVARRASLEDDLAALDVVDGLDIAQLLDLEARGPGDGVRELEQLIRRLKALAGGRMSVMRELRELDGKLGLHPKAMADLRWTIRADHAETPADELRAARERRHHNPLDALVDGHAHPAKEAP